jgi:hypothetical protein
VVDGHGHLVADRVDGLADVLGLEGAEGVGLGLQRVGQAEEGGAALARCGGPPLDERVGRGVAGGNRRTDLGDGYFLEPTVLSGL